MYILYYIIFPWWSGSPVVSVFSSQRYFSSQIFLFTSCFCCLVVSPSILDNFHIIFWINDFFFLSHIYTHMHVVCVYNIYTIIYNFMSTEWAPESDRNSILAGHLTGAFTRYWACAYEASACIRGLVTHERATVRDSLHASLICSLYREWVPRP